MTTPMDIKADPVAFHLLSIRYHSRILMQSGEEEIISMLSSVLLQELAELGVMEELLTGEGRTPGGLYVPGQ